MTIGKKFLERVLSESRVDEAAKKDVDGFKDAFDVTTLPASSPAIANLPMPMARQVVQLYHLMGVSPEMLEMRPKAVKDAAMEVADEMRTNRPLRMAAQRLFSALATAKGFARKEEEVMEAGEPMTPPTSMAPTMDVNLVGTTIVKQMEAVLAALKLPARVLQQAMRRDQASLMATADILRTGAARSKFAALASELGIDLASVGQKVKVEEAAPMGTVAPMAAPAAASGKEAFHAAASELITQLGLDVAALPNAKMLDRKMMLAQRGDAFNSRAIRMMRSLTNLLKSNNR